MAGLLSHLEQGIDRVCSDEEFVTLFLRQAGQVVPRIKAYRERAEEAHRVARPLDHSGLESLRRNIERLIRERRLGLANRLLDRYQLALRSGSFESESALGLQEIQTQVASLFPPAGDADRFSDAQFDLAQETSPLCLEPGFISSILPSLNRGSGSGVSGWTNAFILDVFTGAAAPRNVGTCLLTDLCNKMLAGHMRSPLWLLSRLVLIPKPPDPPSSAASSGQPSVVPLRPLNLPEIFYRLTARAAVRVESPAVGAAMEPFQLGVGIPSGCQIGAKGAQCAFDARRAVEAFDLNSAFTKERRQDTFKGVHKRAPLSTYGAMAGRLRFFGVDIVLV